MDWLLPTLLYGVASALVPIFNAEVYLAALAGAQTVPVWPLAIAAAAGQMVGKLVYYLLGRSSLEWQWVKRHTDSPKFQQTLEVWRQRIGDRAWIGGAMVFVSAAAGIPPFAIVAVLAGTLRLSLPVFLSVGFIGRALRFAVILGAADWVFR